ARASRARRRRSCARAFLSLFRARSRPTDGDARSACSWSSSIYQPSRDAIHWLTDEGGPQRAGGAGLRGPEPRTDPRRAQLDAPVANTGRQVDSAKEKEPDIYF